MEAAMLAIPSVVSRCPVYEETIEPAVTGFLADSTDEWFASLDALVCDPDLRRRVGAAAQAVVRRRYGEKAMAHNLVDILARISPAADVSPRRRRILIVNVFYPPQAIGGATRVVHDNVQDLVAKHGRSFDVEVFTTLMGGERPYSLRSYAHDGVRVTAVTAPSDPHIDAKPVDDEMGRIFTDFVKARAPDLIHFHCIQRLTASLPMAAQALGIPYVVSVHDGWWISQRQFLTNPMG